MTDAAAVAAVADSDLVLFGADSILPDGSVVNKTGTFALCCAAENCGVATLCVTTESKVLPAGAEPEMEEMPPGELGEPIEGVRVRNVYFEATPADLGAAAKPHPGFGRLRAPKGCVGLHRRFWPLNRLLRPPCPRRSRSTSGRRSGFCSSALARRVVVGSGVLDTKRLRAVSDELRNLQEALER